MPLISYPPLGKVTTVSAATNRAVFTVLSQTDLVVNVGIWHSVPGRDQWTALPLAPQKPISLLIGSAEGTWWSGTLPGVTTDFTFRYRRSEHDDWQWLKDKTGVEDGRIAVQADAIHGNVHDYFEGLGSSELDVTRLACDPRQAAGWFLAGPVSPAAGKVSGHAQYHVGVPKHMRRWLALVRHQTPWLGPKHGRSTPFAREDAVLYAFERLDGVHVLLLAYSGDDGVVSVLRDEGDRLVVSARNDMEIKGTLKVIVVVGRDFDTALNAAVDQAKHLATNVDDASDILTLPQRKIGPLEASSWVNPWSDGLTYCTWNSLGKNLTEMKLIHAIQSLQDQGIYITNLIIDDGWQSLDKPGASNMQQGWMHFEANQTAFPKGFKHAISSIRQSFPYVKHIAVWHALLGYWGGISPDGSIANAYATRRVVVRRDALIADDSMLVVDGPDVERLYNDFYTFLVDCGIDGVKTDVHFALDELTCAHDRRILTPAYHSAWERARIKYFGDRAIACMSQTPANLFKLQLQQSSSPISTRNSDDFFPHVPAAHAWHVFCNAHNAVFTRHLGGVIPDWDIFQTRLREDEGRGVWEGFHTAARALSGGKIAITDQPAEPDMKLLKTVTAVAPRSGMRVSLRPSSPGRAAGIYDGMGDGFLRVCAHHGDATIGTSFVGLFDCTSEGSKGAVELLHSRDFLGIARVEKLTLEDGEMFIMRAYRSGRISRMMRASEGDAVVGAQLGDGPGVWEILAAHPITTRELSPTDHGPVQVHLAPLGLLAHMTGAAALVSFSISAPTRTHMQPLISVDGKTTCTDSQPTYEIKVNMIVKALGILGLYVETAFPKGMMIMMRELDVAKDLVVLLEGVIVPGKFLSIEMIDEVEKGKRWIISVDIDEAWEVLKTEHKLGADAGKGDVCKVTVNVRFEVIGLGNHGEEQK